MLGFGNSPQEIMAASVLAFIAGAVAVSAFMRWRKAILATDLLMPVSFLAAYWFVYNKIPAFPPVGAVNKIFFIALLGTVVGIVLEFSGLQRLGKMLALLQPIVAALYIGQPILGATPLEVLFAATAGVAVMAFVLFGNGEASDDDVRRGGGVAVLALGFAPIALLGASSSTFQLCLLYAAASFGVLVLHVTKPAFRFGPVSYLGGLGGLLSVADTVVLVTRKTDLVALAVLALSVVLPPLVSERVCRRIGISKPFARLVVYITFAVAPAVLAALVAFLNYGTDFPV
ncbi:hypothetical protein [Rhizobium sp. NXC24]|uniref:hypothetical protein n=1 Tax=Rhizobium sp. NXC24 TaxID=2048897 RepID=UPI000CDF347A|nr:hypothetical protein [Rhizobium sp. NXC24]AVA26164.1 hypothetical protein NXC24_PC01738 [Rhizobium sp. NXC24]